MASEQRPLALWIAIITGLLTVLSAAVGNAIKGINDIRLEQAQLESQLILNALGSPDIEQRRASLRFLVNTNLIRDEETIKGLSGYIEGETPKDPPRWKPFIESGQSRTLTPASQEVSANTDVDLFVCGKDKGNANAETLINNIHGALAESGRFGASELKVWDRRLYDEIPLNELSGWTTIVVDENHPESNEAIQLRTIMSGINDLPPIKVVNNRGAETAWRISVVLCY